MLSQKDKTAAARPTPEKVKKEKNRKNNGIGTERQKKLGLHISYSTEQHKGF